VAGCSDEALIQILVDKRFDIYVPNIFSPDGDGKNDVFMIFADLKMVKNIKSFQIFSRWGERVFEFANFLPNNQAMGWNGRHDGKDLNPGVFAWYAVIELVDGEEVLLEGDVTLKR
jgi:gliding motility-associated-like protein